MTTLSWRTGLAECYRTSEWPRQCARTTLQALSPSARLVKSVLGDKITAYQAESERAEVRYVLEKIKELVRTGAAYRDFLVLYRTNAQSRVFEEGFLGEAGKAGVDL